MPETLIFVKHYEVAAVTIQDTGMSSPNSVWILQIERRVSCFRSIDFCFTHEKKREKEEKFILKLCLSNMH